MEIVVGKCQYMCPKQERLWREKNGLLHRYEVSASSFKKKNIDWKSDPSRTVKQYSRPAAGRNLLNANDLRPLPVLERTVRYLADSLMTRQNEKWVDIYEFCSDRLRSINQDLTIQRISGLDAWWILQSAVCFFLYSDYRLLDEPCVQRYDATINSNMMMDCLKQFLSSHKLCHAEAGNDSSRDSLANMVAIYILFNLDSPEALQYALTLHKSVRCQAGLSAAIRIGLAHAVGDYLYIFRALHRLPVLLACCLHRHIQHLHKQFLLRLSHGYNSKACRFPLDLLTKWLQLSDVEDTLKLCSLFGLPLENGSVIFLKSAFKHSETKATRKHDPKLDQALKDLDVAKLISGAYAEFQAAEPVLKTS